MFIKNKPITRIATLFLTLAVLFTSINLTSLITHATDGVNGELAVTNKQNISGSGGWADIRQGYRFYIIDRTCTRQSDIYDFVYEAPTQVGVFYTNTRWEPVSTDTSHWHMYPISDLVNLCQGSINASDILNIQPMFITSKDARYVNGDEFQYWFIGTTSGDTPLNLPSGGTTGGNTGGGSSFITGDQNIAERTPEEQQRIKEEQKQDALSKATTMDIVLNSFDNKISNCTSYYHNHYYEYFNKNNRRINNSISVLKGIFASYATNGKKLGLSDAEAKAYASYFVYQTLAGGYPDNIKNWITCAIAYSACFDGNGKTYYTNDLNSSTGIHTLAKINLPQSKINSILPDPLLTQNIPLAGNSFYPADKMLSKDDGIIVYNFNKDVDNDGSVTALDALRYEIDGIYQYYLVVEPIAWINVFIDGDHHEALRSYGSYYNLLNKYNELGNDSASGMHASYIKELGKNSLVVKRDYTDMVYPVTQGTNSARMSVSQIMAEIRGRNAGYGMQLYSGKDWETVAGTSTYDHSLGTTPGPAPDPTPLPEETEFGTLSKQVTIIKNYVEIKDNAGTKTEVTIGNYVRHENPHTITIEDEPNYKVIDWQTSTKTPPTVTNGSKTPYLTITSNSTKTQAGTDPTTVELNQTEKVLYVKLIKSDGNKGSGSEDTPYTLTESQISKLATADNPAEGVELSTQSFTINHQQLDNEHTITKPCDCPGPGSCRHGWYEYCGKEHKCPVKGTGCTGTAKNHCPK